MHSNYKSCLYEDLFDGKEFSLPTINHENEQTQKQSEDYISFSPNPANPTSNIRYSISKPSRVVLEIYNISGQKVATLIDKFMNAGVHQASFDGSSMASGVYLFRFNSATFIKTGKFLLVK